MNKEQGISNEEGEKEVQKNKHLNLEKGMIKKNAFVPLPLFNDKQFCVLKTLYHANGSGKII